MKKFWLFVTLLTLAPIYTFAVGVNDIHNIFDAVEFIKKAVKFDDITIKSNCTPILDFYIKSAMSH